MRPILKLLPAFVWLWIVKRHAERCTVYGPVIVHDVGAGVGVAFLDTKEPQR